MDFPAEKVNRTRETRWGSLFLSNFWILNIHTIRRAPDQNSMDFTIAGYHIYTGGITYSKTRHFYGENTGRGVTRKSFKWKKFVVRKKKRTLFDKALFDNNVEIRFAQTRVFFLLVIKISLENRKVSAD